MASIALPFGDRISASSTEQTTERFDLLQFGDGYSQVVRPGINSREQRWSLRWEGLLADEAKALRGLFGSLGGSTTVEWQHPLADAPEQWTVFDHSAAPNPRGGQFWDYSATLVKRYI